MISSLKLTNFRSYLNKTFEFNAGLNIIVGPNGVGKTNLLEAILVACQGKSYRAKDVDLINFNKDEARIELIDNKKTKRIVKLTKTNQPSKSFEVNTKKYTRLPRKSFIPVIIFEPDHMLLLTGSPDKRRDYFDDLIGKIEDGYLTNIRQYKRVLAQRNTLLKKNEYLKPDQLFIWNVKLSELSGRIVRSRLKIVNLLLSELNSNYKKISNSNDEIEIYYTNKWEASSYESNFLKELDKRFEEDLTKGFTTIGPHREDYVFKINNSVSNLSASRGESRSIILSLKLAELRLVEDVYNHKPTLLLDDVFSELDAQRRILLVDYITKIQTLITTTNADLIVKRFNKKTKIIKIN